MAAATGRLMEVEMEVRFVKVGKDYMNSARVERFHIIDNEIYISTISSAERTLLDDSNEDVEDVMKRVARRLSEDVHDIIYLEAFAQNDESLLAEDQASNLLYRQWLKRKYEDPVPDTDNHKDGVLSRLRKKRP